MGVFEEYDLVEFNNENIDEFLRGNEKHFLEQMKEYICESPNVSGLRIPVFMENELDAGRV